MDDSPIPRLPVLGWSSLTGLSPAPTACMLDLPTTSFTTSGRASILMALEVLNIGVGDRVLLPTYHCPTMVAPTVARGATPLFYPIDDRGSPVRAWLEAQELGSVRALVMAHYFGLPQPMLQIRSWCNEHGIALVEDCAHAMFGLSGGRAVGSWGDIAIGSLTKFFPVPEGGCITIHNGATAPKLTPCGAKNQLKAAVNMLELGALHGRLSGLNNLVARPLAWMRSLRGDAIVTGQDQGGAEEGGPSAGFEIDSAQAHRALSVSCRCVAERLPRERIVTLRRRRYAQLAEHLSGLAGMRPLYPELPPDCAPYVFPLWVERPDPGYAELRRLEMPVFRWDRLWPGVPDIGGDHGLAWSHHVLQLACHQDLSDDDLARFVATLRRLYSTAP